MERSSNQGMQLHNELVHNQLNPLLHSSSQELAFANELNYRKLGISEFQQSNLELLAPLQRKQAQSFSGVPLLGELLPQFGGGGYEDHSAAQSHDQQLYNISPEFYNCLSSSSRVQGEHTAAGSSQNLGQFGSSVINPSIDASMQNTYSATQAQRNGIMLESPFPSPRNQDIPYSMNTNGFDLDIGNSCNGKNPTTSSLKRKKSWQDDGTPTNGNWNSLSRGYQRYSSRTYEAIGGRYSLYDKRYEDIGLPVDPHLRVFNATNGNGNGESSTKKI